MRKIIYLVVLVSVALLSGCGKSSGPVGICEHYAAALQAGNLAAAAGFCTGEKAATLHRLNRVLNESIYSGNDEYNFAYGMKHAHENTEFHFGQETIQNDEAKVAVTTKDKNIIKKGFYFLKKTGNGQWKIYDEKIEIPIDGPVTAICSKDLWKYELGDRLVDIVVPANGNIEFAGNKNIKSVKLENGRTTINDKAFGNCLNLKSITIPPSVGLIGFKAFEECGQDLNITLPEGVRTIDSFAFNKWEGWQKLTVPASTAAIKAYAFAECNGLQAVTILNGSVKIGKKAFAYCRLIRSVDMPNGAAEIGDEAFDLCPEIRSVNIPKCGKIGKSAFARTGIVEFKIPEGVTEISDGVFANCSDLKKISWSTGITKIGQGAFQDCKNLQDITIPEGVTEIGDNAFAGCVNLQSITLPDSVKTIGNNALGSSKKVVVSPKNKNFYVDSHGVLIESANKKIIFIPDGLSGHYKIPDGVTAIRQFKNVKLTGITIPGSLKAIPEKVFCGYADLTDVVIEEGVVSIGNSAFKGCGKLKSVKFPSSLKSIGDGAFQGCKNLIVSIPLDIEIGKDAFADTSAVYSLRAKNKKKIESFGLASTTLEITVAANLNTPPQKTGIWERYSWQQGKAYPELAKREIDKIYHRTRVCPMAQEIRYLGSELGRGEYCDSFENCQNIVSVIVPEGVTTVGGFQNCKNLTKLSLPNSLAQIDFVGFSGCEKLEQVALPEKLLVISKGAFMSSGLKSITIPESVLAIGNYAFADCKNLEQVKLPSGLRIIRPGTFKNCTDLTNITIPESVIIIGYYYIEGGAYYGIPGPDGAFAGCKKLESVTVPSSVKIIGFSTFMGCSNLKNVTISEGVEIIASGAFAGCTSLETLTLPKSLKRIDSYAFKDCKKLKKVNFKSTNVKIGDGAFSGCPCDVLVEEEIPGYKSI